ncbi:MAG: polysaccharide deacetylase family protein [Proteobacteria bacterium]|nr:polysaccharide deacetylase family protein [Pseudomonadota bacterium]
MTRDLVGYGGNYPVIRWPEGARIALSLVVHFEEGAEQTPADGDREAERFVEGLVVEGRRRDLNIESMFEYGSRRGIWRLLDLLDKYGAKATFLCCGLAMERNPVAAREIVARGHEACGHGYRWVPYYDVTRDRQRDDIRRTVAAVEATTGRRPVGWSSRVPNADTRGLLIEEGGFLYDSDSYGDDLPHHVDVGGRRWLTIPHTLDVTDERFWAIWQSSGYTNPGNFLRSMTACFDSLYMEGETRPRMMSVALRPRISGRPSRARQLDLFLRYVSGFPGVWVARRCDIAEWWRTHYAGPV